MKHAIQLNGKRIGTIDITEAQARDLGFIVSAVIVPGKLVNLVNQFAPGTGFKPTNTLHKSTFGNVDLTVSIRQHD